MRLRNSIPRSLFCEGRRSSHTTSVSALHEIYGDVGRPWGRVGSVFSLTKRFYDASFFLVYPIVREMTQESGACDIIRA